MVWSRCACVLITLAACRPAPVEAPAAAPPGEPEPAASEPVTSEPAPEPAAESTPIEPPAYELDGHRLVLPRPLGFAPGVDVPGRGSEVALEHIRSYLRAKPAVTQVRIEAHVSGPDAQALSERRALAVARELVRMGVDCQRLVAVGFGDTKPIADASTPEGRAQSTRVEVHNVALMGRLIGGMPADGGGSPAGDPCS